MGGKCGAPNYIGDGVCDDNNNNCACGWDKGDCCVQTLGGPIKEKYCKVCKCQDPAACPGKCKFPAYKGDGNCDDENNTCGCEYDGGDCCGNNVKKTYCKECKCLDPTKQ